MRADVARRRAGAPLTLAACTGPVERARGLLGRAAPAPGTALWIDPCHAIHTFGMRYPIDVVFLDERGLVLKIAPEVPPWRVLAHREASSVLELRPGECQRIGIRAGERLALPTREPRTAARPRAPETRPALVVVLALVVATAWLLGGCAARPVARDVRDHAPGSARISIDELRLAAGLEYDSRAWPAAEAGYVELARREPTEGEHWYRLGVIYLRTARPDAAARALEIAAQLGARPGAVHQSLAAARLAQAAHALHHARASLPATPAHVGRTPVAAKSGSPEPMTAATSLDTTIAAVERLLPEEIAAGVAAAIRIP